MKDFVKPQRVAIPFVETLRKFFGDELIVDVPDGHRVCGACGGLGIVKADWKYGIKEDPNRGIRFGYKEQFFYSCPNCFSGVVKVCSHCNSDIPKCVHGNCTCAGAEAERERKRAEKERKVYESAKRIEPDSDEARTIGMFYFDGYPSNNGFFEKFEEFIEWWEGEDVDDRPVYVWGTKKWLIGIDAHDVVENVCDDLWEEAAESVSAAEIDELQGILNSWCAKQFGTTTYNQDESILVRVPWEEGTPCREK